MFQCSNKIFFKNYNKAFYLENCIQCEYTLHSFKNYFLPTWSLEGGKNNKPKELDDYELLILEQFLNSHSTQKKDRSFIVQKLKKIFIIIFYTF